MKVKIICALLFALILLATLGAAFDFHHACSNEICIRCELVKSFNDGFLYFVILLMWAMAIIALSSLISLILTRFTSRRASPVERGVKLSI